MRLLVCGGRDFNDRDYIFSCLDRFHALHSIDVLIDGGAPGADSIANEWATDQEIQTDRYFADWKAFGPGAGPIRNTQMLIEGKPDVVLAFPGGNGTKNMLGQARKAKVKIFIAGI